MVTLWTVIETHWKLMADKLMEFFGMVNLSSKEKVRSSSGYEEPYVPFTREQLYVRKHRFN